MTSASLEQGGNEWRAEEHGRTHDEEVASAEALELHGVPVHVLSSRHTEQVQDNDLIVRNIPQVPARVAMNLERFLGITTLFPFQRIILDYLWRTEHTHAGDLLINAPTGSGKTLVYTLPIISELVNSASLPCVRALIVLPTRELARQVERLFRAVAPEPHDAAGVFLFSLLDEEVPPLDTLERQAICITTPGRLVEALDRNELPLADLRWLVIDEADRLFRQSYQNWLERILQLIDARERIFEPPLRRLRKLLFSATQTKEATHLAALRLYEPLYFVYQASGSHSLHRHVSSGIRTDRVPAELTFRSVRFQSEEQKLFFLMRLTDEHRELLGRLEHSSSESLTSESVRVLIFAKSVETTHRLCRFLQLAQLFHQAAAGRTPATVHDGEATTRSVEEISKRVPAMVRATTLERFRQGITRWLVCSDVMARGMDVVGASHVINFDVPTHATTFIHRVGRVGRAGRHGSALTFLLRNQVGYFQSEILAKVQIDDRQDCGTVSAGRLEPDLVLDSTRQVAQRILNGVSMLLELEKIGLVDSYGLLDPRVGRYLLQRVGLGYLDAPNEVHSKDPSERLERALTVVALQNWFHS